MVGQCSNSELPELKISLQPRLDKAGTVFDIGRLNQRALREENVAQIRRRSQAVPVAGDRVLCRSLGRYKLFVDSADVGFGAHLMLDGFWEFGVTEFIARNVKPGMTALDLGANVGYYTLLMAELVGAQGRVLAFEPNRNSAQNLMDSVSINGFSGRVTTRREAIWHSSGVTAHFLSPAREPKNAAVVSPDRAMDVREGESLEEVQTFALDDLQDQVAFAKADIEGAEEKMWRGSQSFFRRNPAMTFLLEFNCARCAEPGRILDEISELFRLRALNEDSKVVDVQRHEVLATAQDWMLVLSRENSDAL
jgi:FkbM family methyltransferase